MSKTPKHRHPAAAPARSGTARDPQARKMPSDGAAAGAIPATVALPVSLPFRSGALSSRKPTRFDLRPSADERAAIATELGLLDLPALRLKGEIRPSGARDFLLEARLDAQVVQPCAVTLAPVPATIGEDIARRYLADWAEPEAEETEMTGDDSSEALPEVVDIGAVVLEALSLALPLYPRAPGAAFAGAEVAPPGTGPITEEDVKPFAGLQALRDRLAGGRPQDTGDDGAGDDGAGGSGPEQA